MRSGRIEARLERMERNQTEFLVGLALVNDHLKKLNGDVSATIAEVGGILDASGRGNRETIRDRLHILENDKAAAIAAHAALETVKIVKNQAWSIWQKRGIFAITAAAGVEGFLRLMGVGG